MGSVWAADHLTLHTQVAVKFMTEHLAQNADAAARFSREAAAAAQIKSPHVVQTFDHGLYEGRIPYIVMELLEGEELSARLRRQGALSVEVTAQIVTQVCKALSKAHAKNVIHRDIKPDNIFLIESDGEIFVKVLDFGIAKQTQENVHVTSTGAVIGTPHYMSPEQMLSSKHVDARSDLWAVGVVAYQCVTGTLPFDGETFAAIAVAVAQANVALPFAQRRIGSPELDAWFARALCRDVTQRLSTARELADAFSAAASVGGVRPVRPSAAQPVAMASWGHNTSSRAQTPAASPKTFGGVAATMSGTSSRRAVAIGAAVGLALLFVLIGLAAITLRGHGAAGIVEQTPAATVEAVTAAEPVPEATEKVLEPLVEPVAGPVPPASEAPESNPAPPVSPESTAPAASAKPAKPAKRVAPRPRPAERSTPKEPVPKPKPTIVDRGF
jgi:serine/threonine-protein kinase